MARLLEFSKHNLAFFFSLFLLCSWGLVFTPVPAFNEMDVLPIAKQTVMGDWISGDWYLNLPSSYRWLFNQFAGGLAAVFSLTGAAFIGRLVTYLLFALAVNRMVKKIGVHMPLFLLALLLFLEYPSLVAGEWIVGGFEAKAIAYGLALLGSTFWYDKRFLLGGSLMGLACSFHILAGGYIILATIIAQLLVKPGLDRKWWMGIGAMALASLPAAVFVITHFLSTQNVDTDLANHIYIELRLSHHLWPESWVGFEYLIYISIAIIIYILVWKKSTSTFLRFVSVMGITSVLIFVIGLIAWQLELKSILKLYPFRFADSFVPFSAIFILSHYAKTLFSLQKKLAKGLGYITKTLSIVVITSMVVMFFVHGMGRDFSEPIAEDDLTAYTWIKENTDPNSSILVPPTADYFYWYAERSTVALVKCLPQSEEHIIDWHDRLLDLSNSENLEPPLLKQYDWLNQQAENLDESSIQSLCEKYQMDYVMVFKSQSLDLQVEYNNPTWEICVCP